MFKIKLMGAIRADWGEKRIILYQNEKKNESIPLKDLLSKIRDLKEEKFGLYFDNDLSPKRGTIIIINGIDYNVIGGLNASISKTDEIIFIPTISGG